MSSERHFPGLSFVSCIKTSTLKLTLVRTRSRIRIPARAWFPLSAVRAACSTPRYHNLLINARWFPVSLGGYYQDGEIQQAPPEGGVQGLHAFRQCERCVVRFRETRTRILRSPAQGRSESRGASRRVGFRETRDRQARDHEEFGRESRSREGLER